MPPRIDPAKKPVPVNLFDSGAYQSPFAAPGASPPPVAAPPVAVAPVAVAPSKASPTPNVEGSGPKWIDLKGNPSADSARLLTNHIASKPLSSAINAPIGQTFKAGQNASGSAMNAPIGQTPGASGTSNPAKSSAVAAKPAGGANLFSGEFKTGLGDLSDPGMNRPAPLSKFGDPGLNGPASGANYSSLAPKLAASKAAAASPGRQVITRTPVPTNGARAFNDSRAGGQNAGAYASPQRPPPPKDNYAEFQRQTGTPFDKNSVQDRESMKRMMASSDGKSGTLSSAQWRALKKPTTR